MGWGSETSGARRLVNFSLAVERFDFGEFFKRIVVSRGDFEKLDGPRKVIPTAVVLKNERCSILPLCVRFEGEALMHSALSVLESDLRKVLEHPVSFESWDVLVEKKVAIPFLPFLDVKGFGYGHAIHAKEPQLGNIVVDVQSLVLAFPHSLTLLCVVCLSFE